MIVITGKSGEGSSIRLSRTYRVSFEQNKRN